MDRDNSQGKTHKRVKAMKRQTKTKPISKEEKSTQKNKGTGKKGRPVKNSTKNETEIEQVGHESQSFSIDSVYNNIDLIKNAFLEYMNNIGYTKGLVFTDDARTKLRSEQDKLRLINWDRSHQWNENEQKQKISEFLLDLIEGRFLKPEEEAKMQQNYLDIGDIFPRQITNEVYLLITELLKLSFELEIKNRRQLPEGLRNYLERVSEDQTNYIFLTGKFTKQFPPKEGVEIKVYMGVLFKEIVKNFKEIINDLRSK